MAYNRFEGSDLPQVCDGDNLPQVYDRDNLPQVYDRDSLPQVYEGHRFEEGLQIIEPESPGTEAAIINSGSRGKAPEPFWTRKKIWIAVVVAALIVIGVVVGVAVGVVTGRKGTSRDESNSQPTGTEMALTATTTTFPTPSVSQRDLPPIPKPSSSSAAAATPEEPADSDGPIFWYGVDHKYGAFSQFFPAAFTVPKAEILRVVGQTVPSPSAEQKEELVTFNRAEQFMMYSKAICFHDPNSAALILRSQSPKEQKSLGRKVENFTDQKWNAVKRQVVELGSTAKFGQNEDLRAMLLGTGDRELIEAAPRDRVWGIGFGEKRARTMTSREKWGQNLLGKALVKARENLRKDEEESKPEGE